MTEYKTFDEKEWNEFGKALLKDKGSTTQEYFLRACASGKDEFLNYIYGVELDDGAKLKQADAGVCFQLKHRFSENEFCQPPDSTEEFIWNEMKNLPDEIKFSCGFWGCVVVNMIQNEYIKPDYLATGGNGGNKTGRHMIETSLQSPEDKREKAVDDCVRKILRFMCNPAPRGKRIVFNDFPLGKSYWRRHWANKMSNKINEMTTEEILEALSQKNYGTLAAKMHSGKSYVSATNLFGGALLFLHEHKSAGKNLEKIINQLGFLSAWKALEMQSPANNCKDIQQINTALMKLHE